MCAQSMNSKDMLQYMIVIEFSGTTVPTETKRLLPLMAVDGNPWITMKVYYPSNTKSKSPLTGPFEA